MKKLLLLTLLLFSLFANSQIVIDNNAPYNTPQFLVDDILLGGGVVATNHVFMGHPSQIGWFNAINTPLGIDSGVVMGSGDIYALDPVLEHEEYEVTHPTGARVSIMVGFNLTK